MKYLLIAILFAITGCSTASRQEYNDYYSVKPSGSLEGEIFITTEGGVEYSGSKTTMIGAGNNVFINVPTNEKGRTYGKLDRRAYGYKLANLLKVSQVFDSVNYFPESEPLPTLDEVLHIEVRFHETFMAQDGWPTEFKVTISIYDKNKLEFLKNYSISSGYLGGGCWSCYAIDVAEKKLNTAFFKDLNEWLANEN